MTLAETERYDRSRVDERDGHAVVVGASVAGLLAARVLSDAYSRVTVLDRDPLPDESVARRGVPQADHPHVLLEAGRATIEDLFPGYCDAVVSAGGMTIDWTSDHWIYAEGDYLADGTERIPMYCASRPLFERELRRRVGSLDGVELRGDRPVTGYPTDGGTVTGVTVRDGDGGRKLPADLVVDATGRTSRTPRWLADNGFDAPDADEVTVDITYATARVERPPDDRRAIFMQPEPARPRGWGAFPVEGGEWIVTMTGMNGVEPPADREGFVEFAADLPTDDARRLVEDHAWVSGEVEQYPFPSNVRRYYERLDRFPEGLVVVGDAIASFNPIYGQGMSVAALEAIALHECLAEGYRADVAPEFFGRAADAVDIAWTMAVGADVAFPGTEGPAPTGAGLFDRYLSRLLRKAHTDGRLRNALGRVVMMAEPPTSLLRPGVAARVLRPGRSTAEAPDPSRVQSRSSAGTAPADD